jgi:uncharacterized membrane protein YdjX (TVP38/TMEM64 family)
MPEVQKECRHDGVANMAGLRSLWRFVPLVFIAGLTIAVFASGLNRKLSLEALVHHRAAVDAFVDGHMVRAIAIYIAVYVAAVALSLPGASFLTISGGLLFGTLLGGTAAIVSATLGAIAIFLIARTALGQWLVRCAGPRIATIAAGFRHDAFNYLLFLRLIPVFPFWLVNLIAAAGGVALAPFAIATFFGIMPLAFLGAFLGDGLDSILATQISAYTDCRAGGGTDCHIDFGWSMIATPKVVATLCVLCLFALAPLLVRRARGARQSADRAK